MKEILYNKDNLKDEEITETSVRIKVLLINNGDIYLGNGSDIYQFPGGHLEEGETFNDCLKRELLEEAGIEIDDEEITEPFMKITYKNKDWPEEGKNRKVEFYYYAIETDKLPDENNTNLTENEKSGNYRIDIVPLDKVIDVLKENMPKNERNNAITPDMIKVIEEYLK